MKVALVQLASPDAESQSERIVRAEGILRSITDADLIVLPELWSIGYFQFKQYDELGETPHGPTVSMCSRVAKDLAVYIHIGSIVEKAASGDLRNTSILLNPLGEVVHSYSKIHVFGYKSQEADLLTPGSALPVVQTPFGTIAGTTCYDLRFPGLWLELGARGAEIVIVPAAWPLARLEHWRLLTSARALEHQIFVLACNATGTQDGVSLAGHSRVIDPSGVVLAECGTEEEVLLVDMDPGQISHIRKEFPVLQDRLASYNQLTT